MPDLMTAILFEKNARALVVRSRVAPFAGQYVLPIVRVGAQEAAEEAMRRHAREQFGLTLEPDAEAFVETVYLSEGEAQYVANIFRAPLPDGPMRFNAQGDYDDARWCTAADLDAIEMPPDLRIPLVKILTDPASLHELDWDAMGKELTAQAIPLAERTAGAERAVPEVAAPDNKAGWEAIARAYNAERYGDRDDGRLRWSEGLFEDDLHVLDDVRGKRALVLGCGGGQDVVALSAIGAIAVGIDYAPAQIALARKYALKHGAENASFAEGDVADLSRFDDASFDLAISIHTLGFVEDVAAVLAETARVLKSGSVLALAVEHPFNHTRADEAPYGFARPYWTTHVDWEWAFADGASATFRRYTRTTAEWFQLLAGAGFSVEQLLEPKVSASGEDAPHLDTRLAALAPHVLILKARKR